MVKTESRVWLEELAILSSAKRRNEIKKGKERRFEAHRKDSKVLMLDGLNEVEGKIIWEEVEGWAGWEWCLEPGARVYKQLP